MVYCRRCHEWYSNPKLGPKKILDSGFLRPTVYDLKPHVHYYDHSSVTQFYFFNRDTFCPRCGQYLGELDSNSVDHNVEQASMDAITRFFRYGYDHPETNGRYCAEEYGYPGNEW